MRKAGFGRSSSSDSTPNHTHHPGLSYRIGDLLWCQEARNNKLWWPAMVTYDPNQGIFFRMVKQKVLQYHVQYFGISAIRGWVTGKSCIAFCDISDKEFDLRALPKKTRAEYEVAMQEVSEAKLLDHKQRKLKYIFSFGPPRKDKKPKESVPDDSVSSKVKKEPCINQQTVGRSSKVQDVQQKPEKLNCKRTSSAAPVFELSPQLTTPAKRGSDDKGDQLTGKSRRKSLSEAKSKKEAQKLNKGASAVVVPTLCFHDQHSNNKAGENSATSDPSFPDCDLCMDYVCSSDSIQLTCPAEVETVQALDLEGSSNTIVMFVQKKFTDDNSSPVPLPTPGAVLTKGTPTVNAITEVPSSVSDFSSNQYGNGHLGMERTSITTPVKLSESSGNSRSESSESRNEFPVVTAGVKRKRKGSNKDHRSRSSVLSNLLVAQSVSCSGMETEEPVSRQFRHSTATSQTLSADGNGDSLMEDSLMEDSLMEDSPLASVAKQLHQRRRHSEQRAGAVQSRRSSRLQSVGTPVSNDSTQDSLSAMSVVDSGSETGLTPTLLTPVASSPAGSSMEVDVNVFDTTSSSSSMNRPVKKRSKPTPQALSDTINLCSICESSDTGLLICKGFCFNYFHIDCLGLIERPKFDFVCDECIFSSGSCFVCNKAEGQLYECSKSKCSRLYHLECIKNNKLFQFNKNKTFICAFHVCAKCTSIGRSSVSSKALVQCVKCPIALHYPDCVVAGSEMIDNTHMVCYQHLKITDSIALYRHINLNTCLECGDIGSLYCCDMCSAAYHLECLDEDARPLEDTKPLQDTKPHGEGVDEDARSNEEQPEEDGIPHGDSSFWKCPNCAVHDLPTYNSLVVTKFGRWRWWPSEVISPDDIPDNILAKKPGECMFVVRFCGSREFCWTHHGRVIPYTEEAESVEGMRKRVKSMDKYQQACEEASEIYKVKCLEQAKQAEVKQNSKDYHKIKTNKYLVSRPPPNQDELDLFPCQCTKENPCKEESTCVNRASHIECAPNSCTVGELCQNQRMLKFQNAKTETFFTGSRGWGLKASTNLSKGDFVIEYVGEILDEDMCRDRITKAHEENIDNFYMLTLDAGLVIDAGRKSNHARFINHSCSPNCETQKWRVKGEPRIGIFACKEIEPGTELTFDYQLDSLGNEKKQCHCGSKNCSGFLGERKLKVVSSEDERKTKVKVKKKKTKPKRRQPTKEEGVEEDRHDDACFICRDGGKLVLCDRKTCPRAYHRACLAQKVFRKSEQWQCPWHYCVNCQSPSVIACSMCPEAYCSKHAPDKIFKPFLAKFKTEGAAADSFDDDGVTIFMQSMLLCESCVQDFSNRKDALPINVTALEEATDTNTLTKEEKLEPNPSTLTNEEKLKSNKSTLETMESNPSTREIIEQNKSTITNEGKMNNKPAHHDAPIASKQTSSKGSSSVKKLEQKSKPKKLPKESVEESKDSGINDSPQREAISTEVIAKSEQGKEVQSQNQEHYQQSLPLTVIQPGTAQQPCKKKKKLKETNRLVSPHFSPPSNLHRSPLDSCRMPLSSSSASEGSESQNQGSRPLNEDCTHSNICDNPMSIDLQKSSPEPTVDVVYSPLSCPTTSSEQQRVPRSGLEELLQQNNPLPSQQDQQQQNQQLQSQQQNQHPQHEQLGYNMYLHRNPESQVPPNTYRPNDVDATPNLNKTMASMFQPTGNITGPITSPAIASGNPGYPSPGGFMGTATGLVRPPTAFQQPQQAQPFNPVWFVPNRNGFVNGLDPSGGFGYSSYPPTFLAPNPLGLPYPYFDASMSTLDAFSGSAGSHHQQIPPSSSVPASSVPPTSAVFPSVLPSGPQSFFPWK